MLFKVTVNKNPSSHTDGQLLYMKGRERPHAKARRPEGNKGKQGRDYRALTPFYFFGNIYKALLLSKVNSG